MDRLTRRLEDGKAQVKGGCGIWELVNKLAEYEDTGYAPEQINTMAKEIRNLKEEVADYEWQEELRYEEELGEDI